MTSTLSWETSYPLPFPGEGPDAELRKKRARDRYELFLEMAPDFGDIHTIEWDGPEEDVILLDRTFTSMSFDSFYWVPTYGMWLREFDQAPAYRELQGVAAGPAVAEPGPRRQAMGAQVAAPPDRGGHGARHVPRLQDRHDAPLAGQGRAVVRVDGLRDLRPVQR